MKPGKFSVVLNARFEAEPPEGWKPPPLIGFIKAKLRDTWAYNYHRAEGVTYTVRKVMENAETYEEAVNSIKETNVLHPIFITITGAKNEEGTILSKGRYGVDL